MGADLYIKGVFEETNKKYNAEFEKWVGKRDYIQRQADFLTKIGRLDEAKAKTALAKRYQAKVSKFYELMYSRGYYRDSYNSSTTLKLWDLSWWRDIVPLKTRAGYLNERGIKKFLALLDANEKFFTPNLNKAIEEFVPIMKGEGYKKAKIKRECEAWRKWFIEHAQELRDFLNLALTEKKKIRASL